MAVNSSLLALRVGVRSRVRPLRYEGSVELPRLGTGLYAHLDSIACQLLPFIDIQKKAQPVS
jgi:hypothetical protein